MIRLIFHFCVFSFSFIYAQDGIVFRIDGDSLTDYSSGNGIFERSSVNSNELGFNILVENNTGIDQNFRVIRYQESNVPFDWTDAVCFGINCFNPSIDNPWCSSVAPANTLSIPNNSIGSIFFHVTPNNYAIGNYKLYVGYDCNNYVDSISIQVNYESLGINEINKLNQFSINPNPSDNFTSIQMNNKEKGMVKIVDLFGNILYYESILSSSIINTLDFKDGFYFVTIESEGLKLASRKLVVRH